MGLRDIFAREKNTDELDETRDGVGDGFVTKNRETNSGSLLLLLSFFSGKNSFLFAWLLLLLCGWWSEINESGNFTTS